MKKLQVKTTARGSRLFSLLFKNFNLELTFTHLFSIPQIVFPLRTYTILSSSKCTQANYFQTELKTVHGKMAVYTVSPDQLTKLFYYHQSIHMESAR